MNKDILDHVAICTDSIEKSVKWYIENFKCEILYQDSTWAMLEFQNVKLASDFKDPRLIEDQELANEEARLLYVAASRTQKNLDISGCAALMEVYERYLAE